MSILEFLVLSGSIASLLYAIAPVLIPPLHYLASALFGRIDETLDAYHIAWQRRADRTAAETGERRSREAFFEWLASRAGVADSDEALDHDLIEAQRLTPLIRHLLQEEIPAAVKRCNGLHYRMALFSGAIHLREIAAEPECLILRRNTVDLLRQSDGLLRQYPLRLRLEADDLLHASIAIRKSLLPTCSRCPYIHQTVTDAGERCPTAQLIHIEARP